jgi:L-amino acid N-acyltransferase YncA
VNCFHISIALSAAYRGMGFGSLALQDSISKFKEIFPDAKLRACIHQVNTASIQMFTQFGFARVSQESEFLELELQ